MFLILYTGTLLTFFAAAFMAGVLYENNRLSKQHTATDPYIYDWEREGL